ADYRVQTWGTSAAPYYDQAAPGDYDGDGKADLTVWRASDQTWYVQCSLDGSVLAQTQGQTGDTAGPGNH
ncbi:MAG: peptidase M23, partial [Acidobacteria bacterium]|nr:peptidase M23 [Acidobacteriota bacterium]